MKQLQYVQSATEPEDKGVVWIKVIPVPFSTEMRYFSPVTFAWELVEDNRTLEVLTDRLNTFGTINPEEIKPKLDFEKGMGNTDYNTLEVGDYQTGIILPDGKLGKLICTDLSPETWQPFGSSEEINQ